MQDDKYLDTDDRSILRLLGESGSRWAVAAESDAGRLREIGTALADSDGDGAAARQVSFVVLEYQLPTGALLIVGTGFAGLMRSALDPDVEAFMMAKDMSDRLALAAAETGDNEAATARAVMDARIAARRAEADVWSETTLRIDEQDLPARRARAGGYELTFVGDTARGYQFVLTRDWPSPVSIAMTTNLNSVQFP